MRKQAIFVAAGPADESRIIQLMREFYEVEHLEFNETAAKRALSQLIGDKRFGKILLAVVDNELAGYMVVTFGFSLEFHGRNALIDELYVREQFRGSGLGRLYLALAETIARDEGMKALQLQVNRSNARAQKLYRDAGFKDFDRHFLTKWLEESSQ